MTAVCTDNINITASLYCFRINLGQTAEGINRELSTSLECSTLCKINKQQPLGKTRQAVMRLASLIPGRDENREIRENTISTIGDELRYPTWVTIAKGILPSLHFVIEGERTKDAGITDNDTAPVNNIAQNEAKEDINHFGNWFYCGNCNCELANLYYYCVGCEKLTGQEFFLCKGCYNNEEYLKCNRVISMDKNLELNKIKWNPLRHHAVPPIRRKRDERAGRCKSRDCITGKTKCVDCLLICHTVMKKRFRFFDQTTLEKLLENCEEAGQEEILYRRQTQNRLLGKGSKKEDQNIELKPYYPY